MHEINAAMPAYAEELEKPARYKVLYGGRGSSKTWTQGRRVIIRMMRSKCLILCTRELQKSIADSIHHLLVTQIDLMGLKDWFEITDTEIRCINGSKAIFKGLRMNTREIKSLEGVDVAFVEEAEKMADESWKILIPTIRKDGSEIWVNFNPDLETDPTYERFIVHKPPDSIILKVNHSDNPWFPQTLASERDYLKEVDFDAYLNIWEGHPRSSSNAQIMNGKWVMDTFDPQPEWNGPYFGLDFGFAQDPTAGLKMWEHDKTLYIEYELWQIKLETVDLPAAIRRELPGVEGRRIYADCARPETISHLSKIGKLDVWGCDKWKGSVEDGIAFLRSFRKIVIHPRCKHTIDEARLYSYKTDRLTGDILPDILDKHNHCWDACRYGLGKMIKRTGIGAGFLEYYAEKAEEAKKNDGTNLQIQR